MATTTTGPAWARFSLPVRYGSSRSTTVRVKRSGMPPVSSSRATPLRLHGLLSLVMTALASATVVQKTTRLFPLPSSGTIPAAASVTALTLLPPVSVSVTGMASRARRRRASAGSRRPSSSASQMSAPSAPPPGVALMAMTRSPGTAPPNRSSSADSYV